MGKRAKAGKRNAKQKVIHKLSEEAKQVSAELEENFARRMLPVAVVEAFIMLSNISCIVLHDEYGFGKKRLTHFMNRMLDTWDCIPEYVTLDELADEVIRMTGCSFALTPAERDQLKEYSMQGLAREVQLNEAAREYWQSRKARGWESTTNRRGREVI